MRSNNYWLDKVINDQARTKMVDWNTHRYYYRIDPVIKRKCRSGMSLFERELKKMLSDENLP
jgi:hypothetical protein